MEGELVEFGSVGRKAPWLGLIGVLSLLLVGCPDPPPKPGPGPGTPPPAGDGSADGAADGASDGASDDGSSDGDAPPPVQLPAWDVVPEALMEDIYPSLHPVSSWPDPAGLKALQDVDEAKRPKAPRQLQLEQLVDALLHPSLHPSNYENAMGVDERGKLHIKIGRGKTLGSACMDVADAGAMFPLFAVTLLDKADKLRSIDMLRAQVKRTVHPQLAKELALKAHQLEAHPKVNGGDKQIAALAFLDRNGYGMQFPYLYAYADGEHLVLVFQEVPHMTEPGTPTPPDGRD